MTTPSLKELLAKQAEIQKQISEARKTEYKDAIAKARAIIVEFDLSADDVFGKKSHKTNSNKTVEPKYLDPATGATWTGRGKAPLWIADKNRDEFLIKPSA